MPTFDPAPINEHDRNHRHMINAFPTLFPTGRADFHEDRSHKISISDYFKHLMRYHDDRFAKYPRFRYFAWNSLLRWEGRSRS